MSNQAEKLAVLSPVRAERNKTIMEQPFYDLVFSLQTTLELEQLLEQFDNHLQTAIPHSGFNFHNVQDGIASGADLEFGHSCSYQLKLENEYLGDWRATRQHPFSEAELATVEAYLCRLIYPLRNALLYRKALQSAFLDPLTQTRNRSALFGSLQREWDLARRHEHPLSVIMLDVDHFKAVNDTYGHAAGDTVLRQVADCVAETVRASDVVFRYGGEEFLIMLANTTAEGALLLAERIRHELERQVCHTESGDVLRVTASLGVATLMPNDSKEVLVARADQALYQAKREGRNRVMPAHA